MKTWIFTLVIACMATTLSAQSSRYFEKQGKGDSALLLIPKNKMEPLSLSENTSREKGLDSYRFEPQGDADQLGKLLYTRFQACLGALTASEEELLKPVGIYLLFNKELQVTGFRIYVPRNRRFQELLPYEEKLFCFGEKCKGISLQPYVRPLDGKRFLESYYPVHLFWIMRYAAE